MTPGKANQQGSELLITHPSGGDRYPAQVFDLGQGIAWIEYGWADDDPLASPRNPVHMAEGTMTTTDNGWNIILDDGRTVTIRQLDEGSDSELIEELKSYNRGDRERARQIINSSLELSIPTE